LLQQLFLGHDKMQSEAERIAIVSFDHVTDPLHAVLKFVHN